MNIEFSYPCLPLSHPDGEGMQIHVLFLPLIHRMTRLSLMDRDCHIKPSIPWEIQGWRWCSSCQISFLLIPYNPQVWWTLWPSLPVGFLFFTSSITASTASSQRSFSLSSNLKVLRLWRSHHPFRRQHHHVTSPSTRKQYPCSLPWQHDPQVFWSTSWSPLCHIIISR